MLASSKSNYHDLQNLIDRIVGKIGLTSTIRILEQCIEDKSLETSHREKTHLIIAYLITRCIAVFDLDRDQFYTSAIPEYREGRMACYHLLRKYTHSTYGFIAGKFNQKKRNILYACKKCEDILSVPLFHKTFVHKYDVLERYIVEFIPRLNTTIIHENESNI